MEEKPSIICVVGPTASGKTSRAIALAKERDGEVISVDSRQVYKTLDIGTEKIRPEEMQGIPHYLIDIRKPEESYSAGDFVEDADRLITEIISRGKKAILAGGTHFYFDALLYGLPPNTPINQELRATFEELPNEELFARIAQKDARRAKDLDPHNRHRLIRALEILFVHGKVPTRERREMRYVAEWVVINPPMDELKERIKTRLEEALSRGLIEEVKRVRERVGDTRLNEFGLEYRVIGEYLRGEREESSLLPALTAKLSQYARRQKAWLRKLGH